MSTITSEREMTQSGHERATMPIVEMESISKSFGGALALNQVSLDIGRGEVVALCGANGAGKSTLVRILAGVERADSGRIRIAGEEVSIESPSAAGALGLSFIHQELNLVPKFSALQNMALGYPAGSRVGFLNRAASRRRAEEVMARLGARVRLDAEVGTLSVSDRWMVSLGRSLMRDARVIAMDEPTASFTDEEAARLFAIVGELKASGVGVLYISHRLDEVLAISDRIAVLRNGTRVGVLSAGQTDRAQLTREIVGRDVERFAPSTEAARRHTQGAPVLAVRGLSRAPRVRGVDLEIHAGEIVGLAGLVGAGRTELARLIFGADRASAGTMQLDGRAFGPRSPYDAIRRGVAFVPEERRSEGLLLTDSLARNMRLATLRDDRTSLGLLAGRKSKLVARSMVERFGIVARSVEQPVGDLSGGNQQKVLVSRFVLASPKILILDEPTVGVDVGARSEIYAIVRELADAGTGIVFISSDFEELAICDRVAVMREGRVVATLAGAQASKERLTALCYHKSDEGRT